MYSLWESEHTLSSMILVTATSGQYGRLVVDALAQRVDPASIVASARSTDDIADFAARGIAVRRLDYDDAASIAAALEGVEQVLLVSSSAIGQRVPQHAAVIDAAAAAGVGHLAYTSLVHADTSPLGAAQEHRATEELLAASGMKYSLLRNGWYLENYTGTLGMALQHGAVLGATAGGKIAAAARSDLAVAGAAVLADASLHGGTFELAGEPFTMAEYAATVTELTGTHVAYVDMPEAEYRSALLGAGLPEPLVGFLVDSDLGISKGGLDGDSATLRQLVGRDLVTMRDAVAAAAAALD